GGWCGHVDLLFGRSGWHEMWGPTPGDPDYEDGNIHHPNDIHQVARAQRAPRDVVPRSGPDWQATTDAIGRAGLTFTYTETITDENGVPVAVVERSHPVALGRPVGYTAEGWPRMEDEMRRHGEDPDPERWD
ncbi:MAG TPA: hypothetical protein VHH34_13000, partial [Pseudonocardiaceae bacterium]|nr:hypothetical protein [Pseudonocardiaceae bacterium]